MNRFAKIMEQSLAIEEKSESECETKHLTTDQKLDLILSRLDEFADRLNGIEDQLSRAVTRLDTLAADVMGERAGQYAPGIFRELAALHRAAQASTKKATKKGAAK